MTPLSGGDESGGRGGPDREARVQCLAIGGAIGGYVRKVLQPPAGELLGEQTFTTGTPLGLGVGPDGTLYYADIGITISSEGIRPGPEGTVRRIRFVDGAPQPPEIMGGGLQYPDGIGVYAPKKK